MSKAAEKVLDAVNQGHYEKATELWGQAEMVIEQVKRPRLGSPHSSLVLWVTGLWLVLSGSRSLWYFPTSLEMIGLVDVRANVGQQTLSQACILSDTICLVGESMGGHAEPD